MECFFWSHMQWIYITFGIGVLVTDTPAAAVRFGTQVFARGVLVRTVYVWHVTWLVNSAAHRWGYRNYDMADHSRNNVVVALLTNGEGWHNNHHATPRACSQGHCWWEIDLTFTAVRAMQLLASPGTWTRCRSGSTSR